MPEAASPSLLRSGLHTLAMSLFAVGIGFGQSILIARTLGPANKGGYDLTVAAANLASLGFGLSLPVGATYVIARRLASPRALVAPLLLWAAIQGVATAVIVVTTRGNPLGDALVPASLGIAVAAPLSVLVVATSVSAYLRAMLIGQRRIVPANNGDLVGRVVAPVAMAIGIAAALIAGYRPGPLMFVWCIVLGLAVTAACFVWLLRRDLRAARGPSALRAVLAFSIPAYASNIVQFLNYRLDLFIVNAIVGIQAVGIYALAVSVAQLLWLLSQAAASVLLPTVAAGIDSPHENARRSAQAARLVLYVSVAAAALLAVLGRFFIPALYGDAFRDSLEPFLLLLPGVAGFTIATVLAAHIAASGRPSINLLSAVAGLTVTLALDVTLIPTIGIRGAAIASSASYLTSAVVTIAVFVWMTGLSPRALLAPTRADLALVRRVTQRLRLPHRAH